MEGEMEIPAPGARIVVRDAQWLVRKVERTQGSGHLLHCVGLSEIVRDKEVRFLTSVEKKIEMLDPARTVLVRDDSPNFRDSRLYLESLLRGAVPTDERIYSGHKAAMDSVPYQLEPTAQALKQPRQRILIADAVGLGKTLECGILLAELIRRGRGRRILVVTVKSMMTQFQKELWSRFSIPLTRLDSCGLNRVREEIPINHNPFHYFDKSIISVDTLKNDRNYRTYLENAWWDIIVIDEAHNVAERGGSRSLRARLAELLAARSDSLILLSATPHDGSPRSFASLMNMLDPTAIADKEHYGPEDIRGLFIRRFKKDIMSQVRMEFREREIHTLKAQAGAREEAVFAALAAADFARLDARKGTGQLFRTLLEKSLFSSPAACRETVDNSLAKLQGQADAARDIASLRAIRDALEGWSVSDFSKFNKLAATLRDPASPFHFTGKAHDDRLIIFTERIATLEFLAKHLPDALKLKKEQLRTLRGSDSDIEQQAVVEAFGKDESPVRLLIATDVASEGINLHYLCNKMIHFDVPWSLMLFQQRNGRIDRYGQTRTPHIGYLMTESAREDIRGDTRILELLIRKDDAVTKNIGDPSAFLGVYDMEKEEKIVAEAMESGSAEELEAAMDARMAQAAAAADGDNLLSFLEGLVEQPEGKETAAGTATLPSLYPDDFSFAGDALHKLDLEGVLVREDEQALELRWNAGKPWCDELKYRFRHFPREIRQADCLRLSAKKDVVQQEISQCRREENAWPRVQYLWELHPAMRWLADKVTAGYRRNEAPVLSLPGPAAGEAIYLVSGQIPNLKGHPVVVSWFGCLFRQGVYARMLSLEESLEYAGLLPGAQLANRQSSPDLKALAAALPAVVELSKRRMSSEREAVEARLRPQLESRLERLSALQKKHLEQHRMGVTRDNKLTQIRLDALDRKTNRVFDDYQQWIRDTLKVEDRPYIRIAAVFTAAGA